MQTKARPSEQVTERELRNQSLAFKIATEGVVLLSNNDALPISPCPIALYGSGAEYTIHGGSGSGEVNARHNVTVLEGLQEAGFTITTCDWIRRYDQLWRKGKRDFLSKVHWQMLVPRRHYFDRLMEMSYRYPSGDMLMDSELAEIDAVTCIYVLSRQSGEGHDCTDEPGSFRLDETEIHNISSCAGYFNKLVLVINTGTPIDISPIADLPGLSAVVYMGQLGMEGGHALAAVLTGKVVPSGKLAVTWPQAYKDVPFGNEFAQDPHHARYKEGIYVGYRYYDSFGVTPRYPFGYGLSYTDFAIRHLGTTIRGDEVQTKVSVTNTGKQYSGKEVVQLYVRCPGQNREYQQLAAFAKTAELAPGQSQTLVLSFSVRDLACYDEQSAQRVLAEGGYLLRVGNSSRNLQTAAVIRVAHAEVVSKHRHLCAAQSIVAELRYDNVIDIPADVPELVYISSDAGGQKPDAETQKPDAGSPMPDCTASLTVKDCIRFCAGTGMDGEKAGFRTPGAVGHTTTAFIDRGIPNVQMCDGPAGVRLEKRAVLYPDGDIRALDFSLSLYEYFPRFLLKWLVLGDPDKGEVVYQFVTGFPIEAVVAQTWDTELVRQMGEAVATEMHEYGVMFWLAPAINIVRNPLCGRNYEYYSEDPLLTGKMAAAVTQGVQATKGCIATLKHFSANNQESFRYTGSSDVDEQVLRQIYWRGFEIAVRESNPQAVMTAYNRINGTYCANSRALCTDLLRGEWGFSGLVMTDWMSTGPDRADHAEAIRAGVDIIMPGDDKVVQALTEAYAKGVLSESDIRRAASRVLSAIAQSDNNCASR